jgi:hypothetical protein
MADTMLNLQYNHEPHHSNHAAELETDRWICAGTQPPIELKFTENGVEGRVHPTSTDIHDGLLRIGMAASVEIDGALDPYVDGVTPKHIEEYAGRLAQAAFGGMNTPLSLFAPHLR